MISNLRINWPLYMLSLHLILWLLPVSANANLPLDRIVAVVNEDVIMESELGVRISAISDQMTDKGMQLPSYSVLQRQVLEELIQTRIQLQLAERAGIRVDDETLNRTISNIAAENKVSLSRFREVLESGGYNYETFREDIRNQIRLAQLRRRQFENRISVSEKEIDNFLANQEFRGDAKAEIRISHILLALPENATYEEKARVKQLANNIRKDILAGADFAKMARDFSNGQNAENGGDLGWRKMGQIPGLFAKYIPDMSKGDVSEPIESASGFHIIKVADIKRDGKIITRQTKARHILVKVDELTTSEQAREKLEKLKERIDNGDDFAALAKGNSDDDFSAINGGDLGWISPGSMVPEFQDVMDSLKPGELSEPFRTKYGWHMVQVLDRRDFDNTESIKRSKARKAIYNKKLKEATQNWERELRDEAYVEYRLDDK